MLARAGNAARRPGDVGPSWGSSMELSGQPLLQPWETPFVGRVAELAALIRQLDTAATGLGATVLLAGEPGIGKTRIAEELCATAERRGALVYWGQCFEGEGA